MEDELGFLADQAPDAFDFDNFAIMKTNFEEQWQK
jgi:hypothetical protein